MVLYCVRAVKNIQNQMSQLYTLQDVAVNNGENGMPTWIVVRDIVYDCTNYLDDVSAYLIFILKTIMMIIFLLSNFMTFSILAVAN